MGAAFFFSSDFRSNHRARPTNRFRVYGVLPSRRSPQPSRIDSAFEPSLHQRQSPPSGNAIFQRQRPRNGPCNSMGRVQRQNACRIAASSGLFALNREISVCVGLRGGGRSRCRTSLRIEIPLITGNLTGYFANSVPIHDPPC